MSLFVFVWKYFYALFIYCDSLTVQEWVISPIFVWFPKILLLFTFGFIVLEPEKVFKIPIFKILLKLLLIHFSYLWLARFWYNSFFYCSKKILYKSYLKKEQYDLIQSYRVQYHGWTGGRGVRRLYL